MTFDLPPLPRVHPPLLEPGRTCWRVDLATRAALLLDNSAYFAAAKAALLNARRSVMLLGWNFDPRARLEPRQHFGPNDPPDEIGRLLDWLARTRPDLQVRLLIWNAQTAISASQFFYPQRAVPFFRESPVQLILDSTTPWGACHHQKVLVIDDQVAVCGGGDFSVDRWDSPAHPDHDPARIMPNGKEHPPRHEVMMMVEGPVARALGDLARDRWRRRTGEKLSPTPMLEGSPWPEAWAADFTHVPVGVARTLPHWRGESPVREIETLHLEAIAAARRTIYLENQYFTSPVIGDALAARLAERDGPEVVLVSTRHCPSWFDQMTMDRTRSQLLERLEAADQGRGRFRAWCPLTPGGKTVIVHSKVTIIDDRLLRVGSANINNRSTGFDSECDLALEIPDGVAAPASRGLITAFRDRLLAHYLGVEPALFADTAARLGGGLAKAIDTLNTDRRLQPLRRQEIGAFADFIATHHLGDPTGTIDSWRPWRRRRRLLRGTVKALRARERRRLLETLGGFSLKRRP